MNYGGGIAAAHQVADATETPRKPRDVASIAGAIDGVGRMRHRISDIAILAEGIREKLGGPHPHPTGNGEKDAAGPRCVVDQLHAEIRGMADPLTRIELALRDIDLRVG